MTRCRLLQLTAPLLQQPAGTLQVLAPLLLLCNVVLLRLDLQGGLCLAMRGCARPTLCFHSTVICIIGQQESVTEGAVGRCT